MALTLVPPSPELDQTPADKVRRRVVASAPRHLLVCKRCGGSEFVETRVGVLMTPSGKPVGGKKTLICLHYMVLRNERIEAP